MNLQLLSTKTLQALHRIAKNQTKGAYPFFRDPYAMIALRKELDKRGAQ